LTLHTVALYIVVLFALFWVKCSYNCEITWEM